MKEKLKYAYTEYDITEHAVYVAVVFQDEEGNEYRVRGSAFEYQLSVNTPINYPHKSNK